MKNSAYRQTGASSQLDYLEELILQGVGERGKLPINNAGGGFVQINVQDAVLGLSPPANAGSATIMIEGDATNTDAAKAVRFTENDLDPTAALGFFLGDGDIFEVSGDALADFNMISAEAGKTQKVFVQFYEALEKDT